jgi:hypothetical protein
MKGRLATPAVDSIDATAAGKHTALRPYRHAPAWLAACWHWPYFPLALLLLTAAALYLLTLDNGLQPYQLRGGDLITHQYAQAQGRFSNAPGYPLYTIGGWLWFHLWRGILGPAFNPVAVLSSYSTLWALVALALLYGLILEITDHGRGGNRTVAFLVSAFYAVTYFFWFYAVTTEQYTSAVAWTLAIIWLAFRWERTSRDRYLFWVSLLAGVALAHMLTLVLIIPPLLWFVLNREPRLLRRPRLILVAIGLAALPLLSYMFVYLAGARHPEWRGAGQWPSTWAWFLSFISTSQGRSELTWSWRPFFTEEFPALIWRELTWPVLILSLPGIALLGKRRAILLYATLILYVIFCWIDRQGNWFQVIMPAYALVVLGLAAVADGVWRRGDTKTRSNGENINQKRSVFISPSRHVSAVIVLLAGLVLYRGLASYPWANMRNHPDDTGLAPGWAILADNPPPGTAVLGTLDEALALSYVTEVWGVRPDVTAVSSDIARRMLAEGSRPVAVTEAALPLVPAEVSPQAHYSALGRTLVSLHAAPQDQPPAGWLPWSEDYGEGLRLAGGQVTRDPATDETVVRLAWQAQAAPARDLSVSVRLTQNGAEIGQVDRKDPVAGAYPTGRWSPGEVVLDAYPFKLSPGRAPDGVTVILYYQDAAGSYVNAHVGHYPLQQP